MRDDPSVSNSIFEPAPASSPPPHTLAFCESAIPIDRSHRSGETAIDCKKKKGRRVINNAERGAACQPAVKVNLEPFLPPSCPYFDQD